MRSETENKNTPGAGTKTNDTNEQSDEIAGGEGG